MQRLLAFCATMTRHRLLLALSALCSLLFLLWVLWFSRFGVDFRDEGLYFVWMVNPFKYDYSLTQFGFIYHPLFELVDHSIVGIRRLNLLITFALAWALASQCLFTRGFAHEPRVRMTLAAGLAVASLAFLSVWVPTPSYNWLSIQGLLIACMGLLLSGQTPRQRLLFPILLGIGGWLTFMAKPTSGAGLAVCALVYMVTAHKLAWRPLLLTVAVTVLLLLGSALVIDGSVPRFVERYQIALRIAQTMMGDKNEMSLLPRFGALRLEPVTVGQIISGVCALVAITWLAARRSRVAIVLSQLALLALAIATLLVMSGRLPGLLGLAYYKGLVLGIVPLAAFATLLLGWCQRSDRPTGAWPDIFLMLAMPVVYVLGTGNDNWWQVSQAGVFWVIAATMLATMPASIPDSQRLSRVLVIAMATQFLMAGIVQTGIEAPYGQAASLRDQHHRVTLGSSDAGLRLTPGFASYLEEAQRKSSDAGFAPGTPMLDLTGRSPTTLYAMGASSTAGPWLIGGYPGSAPMVSAMIDRASCAELARAWLLYQPVGPTSLPPEILAGFGADMEADYYVVGTITLSERFFGFPQHWTQHLLKPRRAPSLAEVACVKARSLKR